MIIIAKLWQEVCYVHHIHEPLFSQLLHIKAKKNVFKKPNYLIPFPYPFTWTQGGKLTNAHCDT
jgi:hypothetical protein